MTDQTIICPECKAKIPLTETLSEQIKQQLKVDFERQNLERERQMVEKLKELETDRKNFEENKKDLDKIVKEKLEAEKVKLWEIAQQKAKEKLGVEIKDLQTQNEEKDKKIAEAQKFELESRRKIREIEDREKNFELELQRKIDTEREKLIEDVKKQSFEEAQIKLREKDKQMEMMKKTIEDLKRKSEQGSMQIQGEVQEDTLKDILINTFPLDTIEDVPQGVKGADLIQTINSRSGQNLGIILWESKNTKNWSHEWLRKLKDDQGIINADVSILVSRVLPEEVKDFKFIDGIWVCNYHFVLSLAQVIRLHLIEMGKIKKSLVGKDEKMEVLYKYLSGSQFRNKIENILKGFIVIKDDLDSEKRAMQRVWNKREKEIERVIENTSGMYGDLQGIMGASALPSVEILELPGVAENDEDREDKDNSNS